MMILNIFMVVLRQRSGGVVINMVLRVCVLSSKDDKPIYLWCYHGACGVMWRTIVLNSACVRGVI